MNNELISPSIQNEIKKILTSTPSSHLFGLRCRFYNNRQWQIDDTIVRPTDMEIIQDTAGTTYDAIVLRAMTPPGWFKEMYYNRADLRCSLRLEIYDGNDPDKPIDVLEDLDFSVLIRNARDIHVSATTDELDDLDQSVEDDLIPVEFELVDDVVYNMRKVELAFLARNATVGETIVLAADRMGIPAIHMIPPDNKRRYDHIIVPPSLTYANMLDYFQNSPGLGVYWKGCNRYYTNGVLYVYPSFETQPSIGRTVHIYNSGESNYVGVSNTSRVDSAGNYHLLATDQKTLRSLSQEETENTLPGRGMIDTEAFVDDWITVDKNNTPVVNDNHIRPTGIPAATGMRSPKKGFAGRLDYTEGNPFRMVTPIAHSHADELSFVWNAAIPFVFRPGHPIFYHYDAERHEQNKADRKRYPARTLTGTMRSVHYVFVPSRQQEPVLFSCAAEVRLVVNSR